MAPCTGFSKEGHSAASSGASTCTMSARFVLDLGPSRYGRAGGKSRRAAIKIPLRFGIRAAIRAIVGIVGLL